MEFGRVTEQELNHIRFSLPPASATGWITDWKARIFSCHDETYSPELTVYLVDQLNKATGLNLPKPRLITPSALF